ncbi:MAG: Gfo/Idh/MocA family oxidoreductase [Acidimicrobiia bacterium]|nr:Gfo/Idh/MocA family oxidoreductase [Acidimicrobiia bacterium]
MSETRYGVIGTGMMGIEHILNIAAIDGAVVTAIADPHEGSRRAAASAVGSDDLAVFHDHKSMMEYGGVDAVVIASPNMTHADVLGDVLRARSDLHVLIEKPLCTTVEDCQKVVELAEGREGIVWMGLEYRYKPSIARLVREVADGATGQVRMVAIREHRFPFLPKVGDWNRFNRNTGGTMVEKCCHFFDLMNLIVGSRPVSVMASGAQDVNHLDEEYEGEVPDIIDNAYVIVEYEGGARAMLDLCMFAEGSVNEQEIAVTGDVGKVEAFVPQNLVRIGRRADGRQVKEIIVDDDHVAYQGLHEGSSYLEHIDFLNAIREGSPPGVTLEDGLWSVAVGVAAHRSIAEGRSVALDEVMT